VEEIFVNTLPQSELALLGCVMEDGELAFDLMPEWFDDLRVGEAIFKARSLLQSGKPCNSVEMGRQGVEIALIVSGQQECHSTANFKSWRDDVLEGYEKRRLKGACEKFLRLLPTANGSLRTHVLELDNELMSPGFQERKTLGPKECANELSKHLEERFNSQGKLSGLESGFSDLDRLTDGLQFGEMSILAARPSIGKSAYACNLVEHVCLKNKVPTLFLSLEMSAKALTRRILSSSQNISLNDLKAGRFTEKDFEKISAFDRLIK
jgi:replicative DNA helicase